MKRIFLWSLVLLIVISGLIFSIHFITVEELLHPMRIDSVYVKIQQDAYFKEIAEVNKKITPHFYYNPKDFGMNYANFFATTDDSVQLKGWFIPSKDKYNTNVLLLLHDINESKISYLEFAKQFYDRGFTVALVDLRGHGASGGEMFTFGNKEKSDVKKIIDALYAKNKKSDIAIMGIGAGAVIAIDAAVDDERIKVLVAQSPYNQLNTFIEDYCQQKWGIINTIFHTMMKNELKKELGYSIDSVHISMLARKLKIPSLFIAAEKDKFIFPKSTQAVFDSCAVDDEKKEYWLVKNANHYDIEDVAGEEYFNKISVFIVNSIPQKVLKSRFKKLAFYDLN